MVFEVLCNGWKHKVNWMDTDTSIECIVPSGVLTHMKFDILSEREMKKFSSIAIDETNDVTDARLGVPNPSSQCSTCGSCDVKNCEGHFGIIQLPANVYHPYFVAEIVQILNKICPGCKSIRQDRNSKGSDKLSKKWTSANHQSMGCKYCNPSSSEWYPGIKFKVAYKDVSGMRSLLIVAEVTDKLPKKFQRKCINEVLPSDYWEFIPKDQEQQKARMIPDKMMLSPYQVFFLLKDLDPKFIEKFVSRRELLFLTCFPVTPNSNRVTEMMHALADGSRLVFDERTRVYKRLADLKRLLNEHGQSLPYGDVHVIAGNRILDCINVSKLHSRKSSSGSDPASSRAGFKWIKEVILGKRSDHALRMTVVGDPKIRLGEIGIPGDISEKLVIPDHVYSRNLEKLNTCCNLHLLRTRECYVKRKAGIVALRRPNELLEGDTCYRPLEDGDLVLVNRPPSVHQHSLIALSVKILPTKSVISINPLCCTPFFGDFDGDCLHGYIPQSINCRAELRELVSLSHQLVNGQDGRNLVPLSQDSLTAAYLITQNEVFLNKYEMQQLEMLCPRQSHCPTILKAPTLEASLWTGKQLFSSLLPQGMDFDYAPNSIIIRKGNLLVSSGESSWLCNTHDNIFSNVIRHSRGKALEFLFTAQEVLCEWISGRGFSVSLHDIYLSPNSYSRMKMIDEVSCGLQEADRTRRAKQLMLGGGMEYLLSHDEWNWDPSHVRSCEVEESCLLKHKLAALNQAAIEAFKEVSYDLQNLIRRNATSDNSMLTMINAGSKGNLLKLLQQSVCLGLQHSTDSLPFKIPGKLLCASWNCQKLSGLHQKAHETIESASERHVSYAVVQNSFVDGLNPLECFVHALSCRGNFFSDNADLPGTLTRKLMFYMRDLYITYDGTVRTAYGNQIIQFSYGVPEDTSNWDEKSHEFFGERTLEYDGPGGQPVGAWSACSIAEAAYGGLDQPSSMNETSPLKNLKKVLECGQKETSVDCTVSLFLSKKVRRWTYGFEYGALQVKNHLDRVFLSDVVTTVMIVFEPDINGRNSSWVSHFHICKERMRWRSLTAELILDALTRKFSGREISTGLPTLQIVSRDCSLGDDPGDHGEKICLSVAAENTDDFPVLVDTVRDALIPILLGTVIKGFLEFKKVEILWYDPPKASKFHKESSGELFLRVSVSEDCGRRRIWSNIQDACIQIMDLIDWEKSRPDCIYDVFCAYGVDAAWKHFLGKLKSTISDLGRTIHPEHLLVLADCLSITGEFHGLSIKGIKQQRDQISISTPFMQACFSNPSNCFIKAAKEGAVDDILGTLDAVAWGKEAPVGTGGSFDILFSRKGRDLEKPVGIYETLCSKLTSQKGEISLSGPNMDSYETIHSQLTHQRDEIEKKWTSASDKIPESLGAKSAIIHEESRFEVQANSECKSKSVPQHFRSKVEVLNMHVLLRDILHKYPVDGYVNEEDKSILMKALLFHPEGSMKMAGAQEIKIGHNPRYPESRCFVLVRKDGTVEDFSYRKCVMGAAKLMSADFAAMIEKRFWR